MAPGAIAVLRERMGVAPPGGDPLPLVCRPGAAVPGGRAELLLEDGSTVMVEAFLPAHLPYGYHALLGRDGSTRRLILSPGRCHLPPDWRAWGWAVQLYAARSRTSWGIGDLADLHRLTGWWAREHGAGFVMINPLHAVAPTFPQQPSPYFPASRRFRSPLYLAVEDVPGARGLPEVEMAAQAGRALNAARQIDRDQVWRIKLTALEALWRRSRHDLGPQFVAWVRMKGPALTEFATWCALTEHLGSAWRSWPERFRRPQAPAVAAFAFEHADRIQFFIWLQWLTQSQIDRVSAGTTLIQDLPIGVDPQGADAWSWQELLAEDVTIGTPPDEFNTLGQDWGLPPFVPWRLADAGYQPFIDTIRATIPAGGGLRVDHVMGLFRLWWIPGGADPARGAYVRYPAADLLDIVALESHRANALVVGEDLGTVEPGVREAMAEHAMLSYRLLWFEEGDPAEWPAASMAAVTTHDLPTVTGLWDGSDLATQQRLGLNPNIEGTAAIRDRLRAAGGLPAGATPPAAVAAAHDLLARAPAVLLAATLDDAVGEPERPNMPGADGKRDNWSIALPVPIEDLADHSLALRVANTLAAAVAAPTESAQERTTTP